MRRRCAPFNKGCQNRMWEPIAKIIPQGPYPNTHPHPEGLPCQPQILPTAEAPCPSQSRHLCAGVSVCGMRAHTHTYTHARTKPSICLRESRLSETKVLSPGNKSLSSKNVPFFPDRDNFQGWGVLPWQVPREPALPLLSLVPHS